MMNFAKAKFDTDFSFFILHFSFFILKNHLSKGHIKMTEQPHAKTQRFSLRDEKTQEMHAILATVYQALREKGYDPINQIVGYILSEDPTYITNYNKARALITRIDRDELLQELLLSYLGK